VVRKECFVCHEIVDNRYVKEISTFEQNTYSSNSMVSPTPYDLSSFGGTMDPVSGSDRFSFVTSSLSPSFCFSTSSLSPSFCFSAFSAKRFCCSTLTFCLG
jgi:hypothetical protein